MRLVAALILASLAAVSAAHSAEAPRVNRAPLVVDDSTYGVMKNGSIMVEAPGVLANDTDPDGDPLTAKLMTAPKHGKVVMSPQGAFYYRPDMDYVGDDEFFYQPFDGTTYSANAGRVSIVVIPPLEKKP